MFDYFKKTFKHSEKGFTLINVLLLLVLTTILGLSLLLITWNVSKFSSNERTDQTTFYIAEAGVATTRTVIEKKIKNIYNEAYDETLRKKVIYESLPIEQQTGFNFREILKKEFDKRIQSQIPTNEVSVVNGFEENYDENNSLVKPEATVKFIKTNTDPFGYTIESIGKLGKKVRKVSQDFIVDLEYGDDGSDSPEVEEPGENEIEDLALYVNKTIELSGSATINGNVALAGAKENFKKCLDWKKDIIMCGGTKHNGEIVSNVKRIYELPDYPNIPKLKIPNDLIVSKNQHEKTHVIKDGNLLITSYLTNNYILKMSELGDSNGNLQFKNLIVDSYNTLVIDVGSTDKVLVIDSLSLSGHINIIGTGSLTLFVKNSIGIYNSSSINKNTQNVNKIKIYYSGNEEIKTTGGEIIYGSIYAQRANINLGAGGGGYYGDIYTGGSSFKISGGVNGFTNLYLAPNAHFELLQGGHVKGLIVADKFSASGGVTLTHGKVIPKFEPKKEIFIPERQKESDLIDRKILLEK
ncbi:PilX N-terminal domain-containing pilus assembly protein [uncultured Psychrobacillus sp.]|uniref:DUF7305 domain-containing protein n=1 Tax=uncultured Psychrobacillus sp. TaxID=1551585 RepID=UPI00260C43AD|nr:PilX N-terminal domain-containing pilus assembly protein [uncultured Psychrobacillus sp.]